MAKAEGVSQSADRIAVAARELYRQHRARENFTTLPAEICPRDLNEAYGVQEALQALYLADGDFHVAGYKVALTSAAMQQMVGVDHPMGGSIFSHQIYDSGVSLRHGDYVKLGVESEIAFRMAADLPDCGRPHDTGSVSVAVESCMAAVEIIEDRAADYAKLGPGAPMLTSAADLAWNRGCVLGPPVTNWQDLDLGAMAGRMVINGETVGTGFGRDVLGNPLTSLAWVANHVIARGGYLRKGDVVITGSVVRSHWLRPGDRMCTSFEGLGEACLTVL